MAAVAENLVSSDITEYSNKPVSSEVLKEDLNNKDSKCDEDLSNAEDAEDGEEVDAEIVSDIEIILPKEVIESCVSLKAGGESSFWSVNKEAQTSSQLTLHKRDDESVKIRVTVVVLGDTAAASNPNPASADNQGSNFQSGNTVSGTLNFSASNEGLQMSKSSDSVAAVDNSATELSKAIATDKNDASKQPNSNPSVVDTATMPESVASQSGGEISSTEHSDFNGNTEAAKTKSQIESFNNSVPSSDDEDSTMPASGTTVIIVKHVNRNQSTRDMDTQTDLEMSANLSAASSRTMTGSVNATVTTVIDVSVKPLSTGNPGSNGVTVAANSRDIAERLKAREAMRKAAEVKPPLQQKSVKSTAAVYGGRVQSISRAVPSKAVGPAQDSLPACESGAVSTRVMTETDSNSTELKSRVASAVPSDSQKSSVLSGATSEAGKLSCDLCGDVSDGGYIALIRHVKRKHTDCTFVRTYIEELRALQAEAHKCPVCRKGFPTGGALTTHIRACHGSIEWMRAVGGTGGSISSGSSAKAVDIGNTVKTADNQVKNVPDGSKAKFEELNSRSDHKKIVESLKQSKLMASQAVQPAKTTAGGSRNQKLAARSNLAKKVEQAMAAKANAIISKNNLRGKRKLPETVAENDKNKKAKVGKSNAEPANKKGAAKASAGKQAAGKSQEKESDGQNTLGKEDNAEKGKKATPRQPPRRFVCDLCSQVFTTTTVLATHMRYCKTDRGSM